ncbi:NAD(P)-dependent dehydrogenase, short-chain alcohol dehydrogenase family [Burkholderia sp. OK233]|nr:NAD(P)-dependent dehydrogenase, short-chain alcohol dehydrogenase family [Burkholderia sp. OK233]
MKGKVVLITGAARGQGAAYAEKMIEAGASVVVTDVLGEAGAALVAKLGTRATFVPLDVTSESAWSGAIQHAVTTFGGLDILVNNAGIYRPLSLQDTSVDTFEVFFRVNQLGTFLGMKHGAEAMKQRGGGSIVNISSVIGLKGFRNTMAYGATKWAVRGMTKIAALELAEHRIRVNSVHPGLVDTPMLDANTPEANSNLAAQTPLGRIGRPDEIADLVLFLASDASAYITGAEVAIDGGMIA